MRHSWISRLRIQDPRTDTAGWVLCILGIMAMFATSFAVEETLRHHSLEPFHMVAGISTASREWRMYLEMTEDGTTIIIGSIANAIGSAMAMCGILRIRNYKPESRL